jgi:hypothetical protein
LAGYVLALKQRFTNLRAQVQHDGGHLALVRFAQAEQDVQAHVEKLQEQGDVGKSKIVSNMVAQNGAAFVAGQEAGKTASIQPGLSGPTKRSTLTAGQLLLKKGGK